jgi:hypothetical protein
MSRDEGRGKSEKVENWEALIDWKAVHIPFVVYINLHITCRKSAKVLMLHLVGLKKCRRDEIPCPQTLHPFCGFFLVLELIFPTFQALLPKYSVCW